MTKRRLGIIACLAAATLAIAFGHIADRLILWPSTEPLDARGAERLLVPARHGSVEIWRARSTAGEPAAFVLRFYGNADRAERWVVGEAAAWPDRALEVWGVNYAGYGGSTGPARLQGVADSALVAYDALRAIAGTRPIYVFGTSLGTTAALHVAAERTVAGLVLQNPPALRQLIVGEHGWWNLWLVAYPVSRQIPAALDSVANARRAHCPAVFLLAEHDEVVRPKYHHLVEGAYAGPKEVLLQAGAQHNTPMSPDFARRAHAAIARMLAQPPAK